MELYIKNMVCDRCVLAVKKLLDQLQLPFIHVQLGEVQLLHRPAGEQMVVLKKQLQQLGFDLLQDKNEAIVEKIKKTIIQLIHGAEEVSFRKKLSVTLEETLQMEYASISFLFSSIQGISIERYLILQRIERAKELLLYDELSLGEIAGKLGYSSVQYLSNQFKKVTGLSPSHFKQIKENKRRPLDKVCC